MLRPHKDSSWWDDAWDDVTDAVDDVVDDLTDAADDVADTADDVVDAAVELLIGVDLDDDTNDVGYNYNDPVVIFDIDGTVMEDDAQIYYALYGYDGYTPTFWDSAIDTVNEYIDNGFQVVFLSGRPEDGIVYPDGDASFLFGGGKTYEAVTQDWLEDNLTISSGGLEWDLIMYPSLISGVGSGTVKSWKTTTIQDYADAVGIDYTDSTAMDDKFIYAFSSSSDDIDAYEDAGIPSSNTEPTDDDPSAFDDWVDDDDNFINLDD